MSPSTRYVTTMDIFPRVPPPPPGSRLHVRGMLTLPRVLALRCDAAMLYRGRDAALVAGVFFIAAAAATGGGGAADAVMRKVLAFVGALLLCVPRLALQPLIARLECAPWPRKEWRSPTPMALLASRAR